MWWNKEGDFYGYFCEEMHWLWLALGRNLETARKEIILVRLRKSNTDVIRGQAAWGKSGPR